MLLVLAVFAGCHSPYHTDRGALAGGLFGTGMGAAIGSGSGNSAEGALVEVLTTEDGNTWSILLTNPDGVSCLVASGEGWRTKDHAPLDLDPAT